MSMQRAGGLLSILAVLSDYYKNRNPPPGWCGGIGGSEFHGGTIFATYYVFLGMPFCNGYILVVVFCVPGLITLVYPAITPQGYHAFPCLYTSDHGYHAERLSRL